VEVTQTVVRALGERRRVVLAGVGLRRVVATDLDEGPDVVPVLVGRHEVVQSGAPRGDELADPLRLVGGVDEELLAGRPAGEEVDVVVHLRDGHLADRQRAQLAHGPGTARTDVGVVGVGHTGTPSVVVARASASRRAYAAPMRVRWLKACGKLPAWRPPSTSYSSATRPTSLRRPRRRRIRAWPFSS